MKTNGLRVSIVGYGNVAYRLSLALKAVGIELSYIIGRNESEAAKLAYLLNKPENNPVSTAKQTLSSNNYQDALESDIIILAVSDRAIEPVSNDLYQYIHEKSSGITVLHCSGASHISLLDKFDNHGVLYPLMTLSKTKPVDFGLIPFFLEYSNETVKNKLVNICVALRSEYRFTDSAERMKIHVAAVFVSNFINYLTGLAFDISKPNQMFLMPLAIETIRKAFLYEHPSLVQTGPAIRGDYKTIEEHLKILEKMPRHKDMYQFISSYILPKNK